MDLDSALISYVSNFEDLITVQRAGISLDHFVDEYRTIYRFILKNKRDHDMVPSPDILLARFPDLELPRIRKTDLKMILHNIRQRRKFISFLESLNQAADSANLGNYEDIDNVIQSLQGSLNTISYSNHQQSHLVDLFSPASAKFMVREIAKRRSGAISGIPTGLPTLDYNTGGLHKQKMVTIIGRTGLGKSWIDLLFVAHAVVNGYSCVLYPLEMTLFETASRLYTLFSHELFGGSKTIRNFDIAQGKVTTRKLVRFLALLEDKFEGQLKVADVGSLADPYTNERIEAEIEAEKPDMFWVDYITLLKGTGREEGHELVRRLSNGIKNTAMRRNVVGGASAQVNRESIRSNSGIVPRLEHIAYGDAIGQDSDLVISIGRNKREELFYALVKHRGGPEFSKIKLDRDFDLGIIKEAELQPTEDDSEEY